MIEPDGQKMLYFTCCRLLESIISNVNLRYLEAHRQAHFRMKNVYQMRNT